MLQNIATYSRVEVLKLWGLASPHGGGEVAPPSPSLCSSPTPSCIPSPEPAPSLGHWLWLHSQPTAKAGGGAGIRAAPGCASLAAGPHCSPAVAPLRASTPALATGHGPAPRPTPSCGPSLGPLIPVHAPPQELWLWGAGMGLGGCDPQKFGDCCHSGLIQSIEYCHNLQQVRSIEFGVVKYQGKE